jgi:hypothetical protein
VILSTCGRVEGRSCFGMALVIEALKVRIFTLSLNDSDQRACTRLSWCPSMNVVTYTSSYVRLGCRNFKLQLPLRLPKSVQFPLACHKSPRSSSATVTENDQVLAPSFDGSKEKNITTVHTSDSLRILRAHKVDEQQATDFKDLSVPEMDGNRRLKTHSLIYFRCERGAIIIRSARRRDEQSQVISR